ncbi:hypothetical protein GCM10022420_020720 [Streptomyces iranensis]|uniref:PcRGLX/YetA-like C-terminal alpha/alpha toroid domain-containing protein n=1 Tax=Streptomyces iranensis TaxID=576784 RepID=A0A060ZQ52_9ACTN|nr:hypothetical protein [Streptomyces iranensis]CDR05177.1 predicted protein [Streptomyces iranensis]
MNHRATQARPFTAEKVTEYHEGDGYPDVTTSWKTVELKGPDVLEPGVEAAWVSTNATAQYGLAAIQNLALVGDKLPGQPAGHAVTVGPH